MRPALQQQLTQDGHHGLLLRVVVLAVEVEHDGL
jgi:hypothetical protein